MSVQHPNKLKMMLQPIYNILHTLTSLQWITPIKFVIFRDRCSRHSSIVAWHCGFTASPDKECLARLAYAYVGIHVTAQCELLTEEVGMAMLPLR